MEDSTGILEEPFRGGFDLALPNFNELWLRDLLSSGECHCFLASKINPYRAIACGASRGTVDGDRGVPFAVTVNNRAGRGSAPSSSRPAHLHSSQVGQIEMPVAAIGFSAPPSLARISPA